MDAISDVSRGSEIFSAVPVFPPLPKPLNLDDLFGFSEAARKKLVEQETVEPKHFIPNRIFINHIDCFTGKYITSVLLSKDDRTTIQQDQDESNVNVKEDNRKNEEIVKSNTGKSAKSKKQNKEEKSIIDEGKIKAKSSNENSYPHRDDKIPDLPLKETIEDLERSFQDECPFDTSKLTVAEYYEMMELETLESRNDFLNDKLGHILTNYDKFDTLTNEVGSIAQENSYMYEDKACEFEIIGTIKNSCLENINIDGVTKIIRTTYEDPDFFKELVTCGIIIYIVNENLDLTEEATWVLNSIINFIDELKNTQNFPVVCTPTFILVSTFMTWSLTKPLSLNYPELPFTEKDFRKRKPHPNYESLFELEEQIIKAQFDHTLKSVIIVSGIPYGYEENELRYLFDIANCHHHLPIYSPGNNFVPTIHVENLGHVVKQILRKLDCITTPFIFAKDPAQNTIAELSKAVSSKFGTGYCELQHKEFAFINDMISQDLYNKLTNNITLESCYPLFKEEDIPWKYELGFSENINLIVNEFIDAEKINPLRVVLYGVPLSDQLKDIGLRISECCHIPYVNPTSMIPEYFKEVFEKKIQFEDQNLHSSVEIHNLVRDAESHPELILCEEEEYVADELEILKRLNIRTCDDAQLLSENDKGSIVARKLKMRPYLYHGYILEEFPNNLEQANIMFSVNNKEECDDSKSKEISIVPDLVIFFNEVEDSIYHDANKTSISIYSAQTHSFKAYDFEDPIIVNILEDAVYGDENGVSSVGRDAESTSQVLYDNLLHFFSNLDNKCLSIRLDYRKSVDSKEVLNKTLNIIHSCFRSHIQDVLESSSSVINEPSHCKQANDGENIMKDATIDSKSEAKDAEIMRESEEIILAVRSYNLLSYLINFISPTLTTGILEVAAQIPEDPIDFLAEYIFKHNPNGKMMPLRLNDPSMNRRKTFPKIDSKACFA